jgi:hypothetical protein
MRSRGRESTNAYRKQDPKRIIRSSSKGWERGLRYQVSACVDDISKFKG